jgi:DNA-damage-inducible protein J
MHFVLSKRGCEACEYGTYIHAISLQQKGENVAGLVNLNMDIDYDLKREADALFGAMGMSLSTAISIFVRQAVQEQAMPFQIRMDEGEQFHELLDAMRADARQQGFMTDEEISAEIQAARAEIRTAGKIA